jgi:hypothetical protein
VTEAWCFAGRRGGKSRIAAFIAVFLACFRHYDSVLQPGERGYVLVVAADRKQARHVLAAVNGLLDESRWLRAMVRRRTKEGVDLVNDISIEIGTCSFRTLRGYTVVAAVCDEVAFWRTDESANPDTEVLAALRPAMATVPGALLLNITTPYARRGEAWRVFENAYAKNDAATLVWRAPSLTMNPTIRQRTIDAAYAQDPAHAAAEFGAEFRADIETVFSVEALAAVTSSGVIERPPVVGGSYVAFVDPSGGSHDAMVLAIAALEHGVPALMFLHEVRARFSPEAVVTDFAQHCARYGVRTVVGDRYGEAWVGERFRAHGLVYTPSLKTKSELFADLTAAVQSRRVELLDHPRLRTQLVMLERRTQRAGRAIIEAPAGMLDDVANAAAGALGLALSASPSLSIRESLAMMAGGQGPLANFQPYGGHEWTPFDQLF